jgi:hypothetical protein
MTQLTDTGCVHSTSPEPAERLLRALEETPESGRDALITARLHELQGNSSHRAAHLLRVLATSEISGVHAATVSALAAVVSPSTVLRCLLHLPPARSYQIRNVCGDIIWRDALTFVSAVRDGRLSPGPYIGFNDDVLTLGFLLASDTHLPYGHDDFSLHRSSGAETLFLFGASRAPGELLREIERVHILTWPHLNYDLRLAQWTFANPALSGRPRLHALIQNAPQVVAGLRHSGTLSLAEVVSWLRTGNEQDVLARGVAVLHLPDEVAGSPALKSTSLRLLKDLSQLTPHLSEGSRRSLSRVLSADPVTAEIVEGLLPEWRSNARDLLSAARTFRGSE